MKLLRHTITVVYKNGVVVQFKADNFSVQRNGLGQRTYSWENPEPTILELGADEVAAVYAGKVKVHR